MKKDGKSGDIIDTLLEYKFTEISRFISLDDLAQTNFIGRESSLIGLAKLIAIYKKDGKQIGESESKEFIKSKLNREVTDEQSQDILQAVNSLIEVMGCNGILTENYKLLKALTNQIITFDKLQAEFSVEHLSKVIPPLKELFDSPNKLVSKSIDSFFVTIIESENPQELVKFITLIFSNEQLPEEAKYFILFNNLYPDSKIDHVLSQKEHLSPVLKETAYEGRRKLLWQDIIKSLGESGSKEFGDYSAKIDYIDNQLIQSPEQLTKLEVEFVQSIIDTLVLIYQNRKGHTHYKLFIDKILASKDLRTYALAT